MDRCFKFQWSDLFSDGGASFLGGASPQGASVLMGEWGLKKIIGMGGRVLPCLSTMANPDHTSFKLNIVSFSKSLPPDPPLNQLRSSRPPAACKMQNFLLPSQCPVKYKKTTTALVQLISKLVIGSHAYEVYTQGKLAKTARNVC